MSPKFFNQTKPRSCVGRRLCQIKPYVAAVIHVLGISCCRFTHKWSYIILAVGLRIVSQQQQKFPFATALTCIFHQIRKMRTSTSAKISFKKLVCNWKSENIGYLNSLSIHTYIYCYKIAITLRHGFNYAREFMRSFIDLITVGVFARIALE